MQPISAAASDDAAFKLIWLALRNITGPADRRRGQVSQRLAHENPDTPHR
jgi:hypothetical protein